MFSRLAQIPRKKLKFLNIKLLIKTNFIQSALELIKTGKHCDDS